MNWEERSYQLPHVYDKLFAAVAFGGEQKLFSRRLLKAAADTKTSTNYEIFVVLWWIFFDLSTQQHNIKCYKKFELMLMKRAKAYSSCCLQTVSLSPDILSWLLQGYCFLMPSCTGFLEPRKSRLGPSKCTCNAENFIHSLSMSISIDFDAIRSWNVSSSPKSPKKFIKTPILAFKVIQDHWIWWQSRASVWLPISD